MLYTVVRHSAWVAKGDPQFARGVESKSITGKQAEVVVAAGGRVFDSYGAAEDFAESESYPAGYSGLIPVAPGESSPRSIEGFPIYVPKGGAK